MVLVDAVGVNPPGTGEQGGGQIEADEAGFASGGVEGCVAFTCCVFDRFAPVSRCCFRIHHGDRGDGDHVDPGFQVADDVGDHLAFTTNGGRAVGDAIRLGVQDRREVGGRRDADIGATAKAPTSVPTFAGEDTLTPTSSSAGSSMTARSATLPVMPVPT